MYEIIIKTKEFISEYSLLEIKNLTKKDIKQKDKGFFTLILKDEKELKDIVYNLFYNSKTIENIYLNIQEFKKAEEINIKSDTISFIKKKLTFEVDCKAQTNLDKKETEKIIGTTLQNANSNLSVNLNDFDLSFQIIKTKKTYYLVLDLIGFNLSKKDYKLNTNSNTINSLIPTYCFYKLGLDKLKSPITIMDPCASLGDMIIESSLFKSPVNIKKRHQIVIYKLFGIYTNIPKTKDDKNKYIAIVQNNKIFKQLKENISFATAKVKVSQFEFDWLDVKYKKDEIDYIITQFPQIKDKQEFEDFQKEFFYQAEFICKTAICIITKTKISEKYIKKNNLKITSKDKITIGEQEYIIIIINK